MPDLSAHVAGVILAAGLASRFGKNKLLEPIKGRPLFEYALGAALKSKLQSVILVCGPELAGAAPRHPKLICTVNDNPQAGQALSLKTGLASLPPGASHMLFMLADQPLMTPELIDRFCVLAREGMDLACLGWGDYLGPPSLVAREYMAELKELKGDRGAGGLLRKYRERLRVVTPPDARFIWDVDRPQDLDKIKKVLK